MCWVGGVLVLNCDMVMILVVVGLCLYYVVVISLV